jgi:hypothetical protein
MNENSFDKLMITWVYIRFESSHSNKAKYPLHNSILIFELFDSFLSFKLLKFINGQKIKQQLKLLEINNNRLTANSNV